MRKTIFWTVVVLAVLLAIAIPNMRVALDRSKQKRTMADLRTIATALEARATKQDSYSLGPAPSRRVTANVSEFGALQRLSLDELERALVPVYLRKLPRLDGWGHPYDIRIGAYDAKGRAQTYALRSYGKDGRPDRETYARGTIKDFREALVFAEGTFPALYGGHVRHVTWRQVASLIVIIAVAGSAGVRAGTSDRVLTGELVETYCWVKMRVGGPEHARCAIECAKRGIPVAVMDEASRTLFVLLPGRDKATLPPELVAAMGRRVSIRGEVLQRAGSNFVSVQSWQLER